MRAMRLSGCLIGLVATLGLGSAAMAGPGPTNVFVGFDFNADGKGDIARSSSSSIRTDILDGTSSTANGSFPTGGGVFILKAAGNLNNDANADLAAQGGGTVRVTFVNAAGTGTAGTLFLPDGGGAWQVIDAADVNGDGIDEVIFNGTGGAAGAVRIANVATGTPAYTFLSTAGGAWVYAFAVDVNGDGSKDLVFRGTGGAAGTTRANLAGTATSKFYAQGGTSWILTRAGDVDGNGTDDLVDTGAGPGLGFNRVRTLNTSGDPTGSGFVSNGGNSFVLKSVSDFTNDGNADLAYQGVTSFRVTPMTGTVAGANVFPASGGGAFTLSGMEDTNADGFFDLVATDASNGVGIRLSNGTGTTTNGAFIPSGGLVLFDAPN